MILILKINIIKLYTIIYNKIIYLYPMNGMMLTIKKNNNKNLFMLIILCMVIHHTLNLNVKQINIMNHNLNIRIKQINNMINLL